MPTIKSYTDLEQSKILSEILPLESADMYYFRQIDNDYFPPNVKSICPIPLYKDGKEDFNYDIRCWSLAALLSVLPNIINNGTLFIETSAALWHIGYRNIYIIRTENLVDACYELILKLNKLNLL